MYIHPPLKPFVSVSSTQVKIFQQGGRMLSIMTGGVVFLTGFIITLTGN